MKKAWYEKYIGYCFNDDGKECILEDVVKYEDGSMCYMVYYPENGNYVDMHWACFKNIAHNTNLPK